MADAATGWAQQADTPRRLWDYGASNLRTKVRTVPRAKIAGIAAVLVLTAAGHGAAPTRAQDPGPVEAYFETLERLCRDGGALGDRIYERYETVDAFHIGEIGNSELVTRFDLRFDAVRDAFEAYDVRIRHLDAPPPTGDRRQSESLKMIALAVANLPPLLAAMLVAADDLRAATLAGDDAAYGRIEADIFEQKAALYATKYIYHIGRWSVLDRSDPLRGLHQVGRGIYKTGDTMFQSPARSVRSGAFDPDSFADSIEASLRLVETGLADAEAATARSAWLAADRSDGDGAGVRRRALGLDLVQRHFAGSREFVAKVRRNLESIRASVPGQSRLSGPEMRALLRAPRSDIERAIADSAELDRIRRELSELGNAGPLR